MVLLLRVFCFNERDMKKNRKRLFYDIETSFCEGTFWRPGFNQTILPDQILKHGQIICVSWKWEDDDEIKNIHWGLKDQCDKKVLKKFIPELNKANEIVAHNGDRFDIKWLRARAAFHGLDMKPFYRMVDTLKLSKRYFALPSYKLSEVAKYFGLTPKMDPGGLQTWIDIVIHKNGDALKTMMEYCDGDITTLEEVFHKIRRYTKHSMHHAVQGGQGKYFCPECTGLGMWNKTYTTAAGTTKHYFKCRDTNCSTYWDINNKTYMDYLQYKMINGIK